eukprot:TRINITY_DN49814_c0_g1_i2.p1 TRINITY_DN49814_c0_g1~~TRINITY_DN49814_c0_g1_i2.p1  ORF type:complete len:206 (-),score=23.84 TRINITY_DN49814_c0_g1_i2:397-1014(-)
MLGRLIDYIYFRMAELAFASLPATWHSSAHHGGRLRSGIGKARQPDGKQIAPRIAASSLCPALLLCVTSVIAAQAQARSTKKRLRQPHTWRIVRSATPDADAGEEPETPASTESKEEVATTFGGKIKNFFKKYGKIDRKQLQKMGFLCLLSYGAVSNVNAAILIVASTYRAMLVTGASPLASSAALRQFGYTYASLYIISNITWF